ncbi:hypothetical protein [Pseudomonas sp. GOM6]|uniref:hypothetical protein n=1 Tax=Pseudomonas sp. GOM6 TaxID=3036944 RepID=UPI0024095B27|nr:hypothetical protein [Pseudomonas sp. GOM6]MDG1580881.1 hypothetical protein [Pseudomonas sp. GOM6]
MKSAINSAIEALEVAAESGGEIDLQMYQERLDELKQFRDEILQYDKRLNEAGKAPDGDDYNALMSLTGLIA